MQVCYLADTLIKTCKLFNDLKRKDEDIKKLVPSVKIVLATNKKLDYY